MKILHLTDNLDQGGLQRTLIDLSANLAYMGHDVTIVAGLGELSTAIEAPVQYIPLQKPRSLLEILRYLRVLRKIIRTNSIEIIHSHQRFVTMLGYISSIGTGAFRVEHVHNTFLKDKLHMFSFRSKQIIACSDSVATALIENFSVPAQNISIIRNGGRDLADTTVPRRKQGPWRIGAIGRLVPQKDPALFVELCSEISRLKPGTTFVWIGDGPLRSHLENSEVFDKEGTLNITGMLDDVRASIVDLDLVVFTSAHEGLPIAGIEALSLGKPLAVTNVGGCHELVAYGNGIIFSSRVAPEMAREVVDFLQAPHFKTSITLSRSLFENEFSLKRMAAQVETLYQSLESDAR